jgi:hypothetical protein
LEFTLTPFFADAELSGQQNLLMSGIITTNRLPAFSYARGDSESNRDNQRSVIPVKELLFGSLAIIITKKFGDFRPMTLRHQVSLILPFGSRSILTTLVALVLDA